MEAALRNATGQAQLEMFEQEMTRMKLAHQLEVKEAIQKASSQYKEKPDSSQEPDKPGNNIPQSHTTNIPHSQMASIPHSQRNDNLHPEQMAHQDRLQAQKSRENYKEIGSELKVLLSEMRTLISDKQSPRDAPEVTRRSKRVKDRDERQRSRPQPKPKTFDMFPTFQKKKAAFTHYRVPPPPSDISYYSDGEADDRVHNRSRSLTGTYALYSPDRNKRKPAGNKKHRRSKSAEASYTLAGDSSMWTDSEYHATDRTTDYRSTDYRTSDFSPPVPESDITVDTNPTKDDTSYFVSSPYSTQNSLDTSHTALHSQSAFESDIISSLSVGSPVMESTKEDITPSSPAAPNTQELCKRLEERIISLTRMGDNLQKENKEMADLMKTQGKKLRKVKEAEKKIRKTAR